MGRVELTETQGEALGAQIGRLRESFERAAQTREYLDVLGFSGVLRGCYDSLWKVTGMREFLCMDRADPRGHTLEKYLLPYAIAKGAQMGLLNCSNGLLPQEEGKDSTYDLLVRAMDDDGVRCLDEFGKKVGIFTIAESLAGAHKFSELVDAMSYAIERPEIKG